MATLAGTFTVTTPAAVGVTFTVHFLPESVFIKFDKVQFVV